MYSATCLAVYITLEVNTLLIHSHGFTMMEGYFPSAFVCRPVMYLLCYLPWEYLISPWHNCHRILSWFQMLLFSWLLCNFDSFRGLKKQRWNMKSVIVEWLNLCSVAPLRYINVTSSSLSSWKYSRTGGTLHFHVNGIRELTAQLKTWKNVHEE